MGANRNVKEFPYKKIFTIKSKLLELSELIWKPFIVLKIVKNRFDRINVYRCDKGYI